MSMESDVRVIKGVAITWLVLVLVAVAWSLGSWAWARHKAAQAEKEEEATPSSGTVKVTALKGI
jgi:hypothetical protein